jgi:hypothetical protein
MNQHHIELMQHALGINEHNREPYRNYFLASSGHDDNPEWQELVNEGLAESTPAPSWACGDIVYRCTHQGRALALSSLPEPVRLKRQQLQYQEYLEVCECYENFASFLGFDKPEYESEYAWGSLKRVRMKSSRAIGEYCLTKKAAKASYKTVLKGMSHEGEK